MEAVTLGECRVHCGQITAATVSSEARGVCLLQANPPWQPSTSRPPNFSLAPLMEGASTWVEIEKSAMLELVRLSKNNRGKRLCRLTVEVVFMPPCCHCSSPGVFDCSVALERLCAAAPAQRLEERLALCFAVFARKSEDVTLPPFQTSLITQTYLCWDYAARSCLEKLQTLTRLFQWTNRKHCDDEELQGETQDRLEPAAKWLSLC